MDEKKSIKISLSTFLLIIAIIVIIIISYFIYKLYNERNVQTQEVSNLNSQISNLENTLNKLQSDVDKQSETDNKAEEEDNEETTSNEEDDTEVSTNRETSENAEIEQEEVKIPEADNNLYAEESNLVDEYFADVWITSDGKDILVVDYGKRFCHINVDDNSREYGTYTVKTGDEPTITLNYTSGKNETLTYTQGSSNYLMGENESYLEYEGYFFGTQEGDEGIFNK